jgi:hypothetical protein
VKPGKYNPGEKIRQPKMSPIAATVPPGRRPNNIENIAIGKKLKLIRMNGVWMARICVKIMFRDIKTAETTRVFVLVKGWDG